jgi:hypothetical protein
MHVRALVNKEGKFFRYITNDGTAAFGMVEGKYTIVAIARPKQDTLDAIRT